MTGVQVGQHDLLSVLRPDTLVGALAYLVVFVICAMLLSRALRDAVHAAMTRKGHLDRTTISFLQQMGTALLAGASVASVVIGLAAQSTLGNLVAGVSITIYRPFRLGDTLQVAAPTGTDIGIVELISPGYTTLRAADGHLIVLPNSIAASQVTINLNTTFAAAPIAVTIRLSRDSDVDAARSLALEVAAASVGETRIAGCYVTKVDGSGATLELRLSAPEYQGREALRSTLLVNLSKRFAAAHAAAAGSGAGAADTPAFS